MNLRLIIDGIVRQTTVLIAQLSTTSGLRSPLAHAPPHARGAPAILVVGGTGDGVVPYEWSVNLASELESGVLLTRDGVGHVAFSQCVVDAVSAYLVDLAVPNDGTICPQP